ncbi:MAG TPA: GspMb/PilO family protein [Tepidisphaeraceae bacterium]|nr:GspMb/PilO family protein [Tepidisphaeraceae bacterium]
MSKSAPSMPVVLASASVACVLATVAAIAFVFVPAMRAPASIDPDSSADVSLQQLRDMASELQQIQSSLRQLADDLAKPRLKIETRQVLNQKLMLLVELASRHQLGVTELRPLDATTTSEYTIIPLSFLANASYPDLCRFLRELRAAHPDIVCGALSVSRNGTGPRPLTLQVELLWHTQTERTTLAGGAR